MMIFSDYIAKLSQTVQDDSTIFLCGSESLLELLYDAYFETQGSSSLEIKSGFRSLYEGLEGMESECQEPIIDCVSTLCMEHERSGFIEGIKIGFRLAQELAK